MGKHIEQTKPVVRLQHLEDHQVQEQKAKLGQKEELS